MDDTDRQQGQEPHEHHVVGSVADEAAQLVELLVGRHPWLGTPVGAEGAGAGAGGDAANPAGDDGGRPGPGPADAREGRGPDADERTGSPRPATQGECTCGGRAPACQVCPICQVISFVSQVSPETIDKAADLVNFAATALRDLATAQREQRGQRSASADPDSTRPDRAGP